MDEAEGHKLEKSIRVAVKEIVRKREAKMKSGEMDSYGTDFLGRLMEAKHEDDDAKRISIDIVVDECKTFFFGGQETANSMLGWTVFLLASHPHWQEEARKEVLDVFGDLDPTFEGSKKLRTVMKQKSIRDRYVKRKCSDTINRQSFSPLVLFADDDYP